MLKIVYERCNLAGAANVMSKMSEFDNCVFQRSTVNDLRSHAVLMQDLESMGAPVCEMLKIDRFLKSFRDNELVLKMRLMQPTTLLDSIRLMVTALTYHLVLQTTSYSMTATKPAPAYNPRDQE
eukprot:Platyproteum_vivax@DN16753_c0_g1_i1.p1